VTISSLPRRRYDFYIAVPWHGHVAVTVPVRGASDAAVHLIDDTWVREGGYGQRKVWVADLSVFSTVKSRLSEELCLSRNPFKFLHCLGRDFILDQLAQWIASKISDSCLGHIVASAVVRGGYVGVLQTAFFEPPCLGEAQAPPSSSPVPQPPPPSPAQLTQSWAYHVLGTCADGACGLRIRSGPGYSAYPVAYTLLDGNEVHITCQTRGETVSNGSSASNVWDRLTDNNWAADFYIDTPNVNQFTVPIPHC
jgi:hypothetical protein